MKSRSVLILLIGALSFTFAPAQGTMQLDISGWEAGQVYFDEDEWTEVITGDIPLVITVPHGGAKKPEGMADRTCKDDRGRIVRGTDSYTQEVSRFIREVFQEKYNKQPYIIINHVARSKVDQNRDLHYAACGDEKGMQAWHNFHSAADSALAHAVRKFGYAFYIDLHGHGHSNQRLELGYSLTKGDLQKAFKREDLKKYAAKSSMANYIKKHPDADIWELLFGKHAFGTYIYREGIPATPAVQDPHPAEDESFFSGGYNTRRYTSPDYPDVFGLQIEMHYRKARDSRANIRAFAQSLARAYFDFIDKLDL
ncbi:N-formylglutamate amidohydrolase [Sinomicrobium soli]|uniref:N-formylglutamate amidohydrolase n=1 Tax=Sinomicrobium sp. N-1-3-6 TaxID=2219864 RepID=UPI001374FC2F|nr:N-formylglutamate amidohydrolase [Sinomicrobium sp. N-1-3-6]